MCGFAWMELCFGLVRGAFGDVLTSRVAVFQEQAA
jgi:hypothetical protein